MKTRFLVWCLLIFVFSLGCQILTENSSANVKSQFPKIKQEREDKMTAKELDWQIVVVAIDENDTEVHTRDHGGNSFKKGQNKKNREEAHKRTLQEVQQKNYKMVITTGKGFKKWLKKNKK